MMFPFDFFGAANREVGMVVSMLIGVGFGFVLERAGFGSNACACSGTIDGG